MRRFSLALALIASASPAPADELKVHKTGPNDPPPAGRLYAFLEGQAKTLFDARRKAVAALADPQDVANRQAALKAKFRESLGELPAEKSPLNARVVGRARRDGYSVERVVYESRPDHHVTANLYLPDGKPPFPGVLVPCGHSANGKAAEAYQRVCILLATNGLAALCYDPIGQGERVQSLDPNGKPVTGGTTEHSLLGLGALLVGRSAAGYRFWDGVRSLDYLASRPEVDPARIGCTGNSGGGTETAYLAALDARIFAAAPSCYITSLERLFATIGPQDAEQNITGQVAFGMEHADYITLRAPKPTLISAGEKDFFDIRGTRDAYKEVKRVYGILGEEERVDLFVTDEPHGFTRPRREASMRWMRRWLLDKTDAPAEADFPAAADADLRCTKSGQVLREFPGEKSAFDLNARRASALASSRPRLGRDALREAIRKRLALPPRAPVLVTNHQNFKRRGSTIDTWSLVTEPGVEVADLTFRNDAPDDKPFVMVLGADRSFAAPGGLIEEQMRAGAGVVLIEPRGTGESSPGGEDGDRERASRLGPEARETFLSLHLARPLFGQRVFDALQARRCVADPEKAVHLVGVGDGGPIALHLAALDDNVTEVAIVRSILSWSEVAGTPDSRGQLAGVVPGVLESYDLPDLAASIAPRPLTIQAPLDPAGKPVDQATLEKAFASARAAYRAASASDKLTLRAAP